jgi:hypothetical protein
VALDASGDRLHYPKQSDFLFHGDPLATRFRNRLEIALKTGHPELHSRLLEQHPGVFQCKWVADIVHTGGGRPALRYLARYVFRSALGPKRILGYDQNGRIRLQCYESGTKPASAKASAAKSPACHRTSGRDLPAPLAHACASQGVCEGSPSRMDERRGTQDPAARPSAGVRPDRRTQAGSSRATHSALPALRCEHEAAGRHPTARPAQAQTQMNPHTPTDPIIGIRSHHPRGAGNVRARTMDLTRKYSVPAPSARHDQPRSRHATAATSPTLVLHLRCKTNGPRRGPTYSHVRLRVSAKV